MHDEFSCNECGADPVVMVQDVTDDYDPEYYCAKHDPRTTLDERRSA